MWLVRGEGHHTQRHHTQRHHTQAAPHPGGTTPRRHHTQAAPHPGGTQRHGSSGTLGPPDSRAPQGTEPEQDRFFAAAPELIAALKETAA